MNVMKILIGQTNGTTLTIGNVSYSKFLLPLRVIKYFLSSFYQYYPAQITHFITQWRDRQWNHKIIAG